MKTTEDFRNDCRKLMFKRDNASSLNERKYLEQLLNAAIQDLMMIEGGWKGEVYPMITALVGTLFICWVIWVI